MYTHNLSDPSNIQSGFDPVAGEVDGTTIGNAYVARQIFGGLTAFDSRVQEITASNTACPAWLLPLSGNLLGTIAKNSTANASLRFFFNDDPGLTSSISSISANCMVYHWEYNSIMATTNKSYIISYVIFSLSGVSLTKLLSVTGVNPFNYNPNETTSTRIIAQHTYTTTTTTMNQVPKIIFWKSNDVFSINAVDKNSSAVRGSHILRIRPTWQGFASSASATSSSGTIIDGQNFNAIIQLNSNNGSLVLEGWNMFSSESVNTYTSVDGLTVISSAGKLPDIAFSVSSVVKVVTSKLRLTIQPSTNPKFIAVTDELDNILLANSSLYSVGTIQLLNGNYYLVNGQMTDGKNTYMMLLQLSG